MEKEKRRMPNEQRKVLWLVSSVVAVLAAVAFFLDLFFGMDMYGLTYVDDALIRQDMVEGYLNPIWIVGIACLLLCLVAGILSLISCGRRTKEGTVTMNLFDRVFSDVQIILGIGMGCLLIPALELLQGWMMRSVIEAKILPRVVIPAAGKTLDGLADLTDHRYYYYITASFQPQWAQLFLSIVLLIGVLAVELWLLQSLTKKWRNHVLIRDSLIFRVCHRIYAFLRDLLVKTDLDTKKVIAVLILASLLSATWIGTLVVIAVILWQIPKFMKKYKMVKAGIEELKEGNVDYQIPLSGEGEMERLAAQVNEIADARKIAIEKELKSQRLKNELISNVSHDLKTPLTSMVTYVDLLKKEGLNSEHAPEYLKILEEKTGRLQKLSVDLFEAAKASSGDIPVDITTVDVHELLTQAFAELDEHIQARGIQMIWNRKTENTTARADGRLLWRVLENVITNLSKYAMPNSRAYVDIEERRGHVAVEIKNISQEPLNMEPDVLMERFQRGDTARNTEGSGLGLAIANDLMQLMGGNFRLHIDGDLFKVVIELPKA